VRLVSIGVVKGIPYSEAKVIGEILEERWEHVVIGNL
jgi:hypothetical protein